MMPQIYRAMGYIDAEPILGLHVACTLLQVSVGLLPHLSLNLGHPLYTHFFVTFASNKMWFVQGLLELSEVLAAGGGETHLVTARPPTCITCLKIVVTVGGRLRVGQQFGGTDGRVLVFHLLPYTFPNRPTRDFVSRLRELEEVGAPIHSRPICYNYLGAPQWSCQKNHG